MIKRFTGLPAELVFVLISFLIVITGALRGIFFGNYRQGDFIFAIGINLALFSSLLYFYRYGAFSKSKYFRIAKIGITIFLIGVIFRFQHWPYSRNIFLVSDALLILTYGFWFWKRRELVLLNWLKVFWIISAFGILPLVPAYLIYPLSSAFVCHCFLFAAISLVILDRLKIDRS